MSTLAQAQASKRDELVRRIVEAVDPLRIILFGSAARGEMGPDSDLDVLVVMPEGTHRRDTEGQLYIKMLGMGVPIDIIVATPSDLVQYGDTKGLIYRSVLREGVDLYARLDGYQAHGNEHNHAGAEGHVSQQEAVANKDGDKRDWVAELVRLRDEYPEAYRELADELDRLYEDRKNYMPRKVVFPWDDDE